MNANNICYIPVVSTKLHQVTIYKSSNLKSHLKIYITDGYMFRHMQWKKKLKKCIRRFP